MARSAQTAGRAASAPHARAAALPGRGLVLHLALHLLLIALSVIMLIPLAWVLSTSLKAAGAEFDFPPQWIPSPIVWSNYPEAFTAVPFALYFRNSLIVSVSATLGSVLTGSMAAYGFARLRFPGRNVLFAAALSTMMVPGVVTLIPSFIIFKQLHWVDTFLPLIVPSWLGGGAFNIFLLRQFFMGLPRELDEAARVDGANGLWIWAKIIMPLAKPAVATVAILVFIFHWNDFLGPLIYLNSSQNFTLAVGLSQFNDRYGSNFNLLMAASMMMILPMLVAFFAGLRFFMKGITLTGLAGR